MNQTLDVSLSVPIPENMVLISKVELQELERKSLEGVFWTMKDLEIRTNKKQEWLKRNILLKKKFKDELDVDNGGFVFYPSGSGQTWSFQANKMAKFLDDNFHKIFGRWNRC